MKKSMQKGFTLIELMIVIAILGILIAIALPAYQDYSIRAKNAECVSIAASPKLAITETFQSNGTWPADFAAAGYTPAATDYCEAATISTAGSGTGTPTAFRIASKSATGGVVEFNFTPSVASAGDSASAAAIEWRCTRNASSQPAHAPAECRGTSEDAPPAGNQD
ncbi:MAG TPA: prepilin-type N-terminal cleavage/methylation domain-containing protein [Candidatus Luteimonas excrementigallinarum]|nr:prepilin-type N-terminal cleavage/methylation domain-containing protein [Candidatus Luteimonas excrementigallinarum]